MATYVPAKKNTAYIFYVGLPSQANALTLQANPTLAAGDAKVAIDDGAPANLATLPVVDVDFTKRVKVSLSSDEMNGDNITIIFSDAAGDEWCDVIVNIQTAANQIDDINDKIDIIDTVVDAIKAKTDDLPSGVTKNVALSNFEFLMIDSDNHVAAKTGLTITAEISKDGGAFAACTNIATEISDGLYKIDFEQAEMNADVITLKFTATGADQTTITILTSD